jgi:hypothetical protein
LVVRGEEMTMPRDRFLFIGPYAEWVRPASDFLDDDDSAVQWEQLLDGGVVEWNIGADCGFLFRRGRNQCRSYCCMPLLKRRGCPRWPMRFHWNRFDDDYGEMATDWTELDRQTEIAWFRTAFARELALSAQLLAAEPSFRWGLVHWVIP